jgi:hypothetical protein
MHWASRRPIPRRRAHPHHTVPDRTPPKPCPFCRRRLVPATTTTTSSLVVLLHDLPDLVPRVTGLVQQRLAPLNHRAVAGRSLRHVAGHSFVQAFEAADNAPQAPRLILQFFALVSQQRRDFGHVHVDEFKTIVVVAAAAAAAAAAVVVAAACIGAATQTKLLGQLQDL